MAAPAPDDTLVQFSFGPTTQTTVVTTTTTTTSTTCFPPLKIKAPKHLLESDPKEYPLASHPTPHHLRNSSFTLGDQPVVFIEAENARDAYHKVKQQEKTLRASHGTLHTVTEFNSDVESGKASIPRPPKPHKPPLDMTATVEPAHRRQSASPVSISAAAKLAKQQTPRRKRQITLQAQSNSMADPPASSQDSLQSRVNICKQINLEDDEAVELNASHRHLPRASRPRPHLLDTTTAQDISLPSPSLSPVTAAANLQNRRGYFEGPTPESARTNQDFDVNLNPSQESLDTQLSEGFRPAGAKAKAPGSLNGKPSGADTLEAQFPAPSLMSIPGIVESFEAMPTEMKDYVMFQLLRRCPKPVLRRVADIVNPALKCDFFNLLPLELSLNIAGHLDVKASCSAAQVSKKWRRIVDSNEKAWKNRFDADGYQLPEGELQRAIREGWGWQYASGPNDWEKDLSVSGSIPSDTELSASSSHAALRVRGASIEINEPAIFPSRRGKRKAGNKSSVKSRKQQKRSHGTTAQLDADLWMEDMSTSDGAYTAASAAAVAVPHAQVGLSSLKNLHLFKSLYQRHHLIRRSWMNDEAKPSHLAFRAHQRHVVTCLQFDADKILTGSDDTNINVYDTQTGVLRAKLEGHEGGVWALQYEGNVLVSGSTDRSVRVWDIEKGICTQVFQGHTSTVRCLQILMPTPTGLGLDGKQIMMPKQPLVITGSRDSNLRVWKLPKSTDEHYVQAGPAADDNDCPFFVRVLTGHHHSVRAIAAHADTLVSGSYDCSVRVWKISTGETLHRLQGHTQKVYSVVLDYKRNRCISGSMDNSVKVWSLDTGTALFNLEGHSSLVGLLDLQGDRLVSAAADSTLRIWDPESGQCKSTLTAHTGAITCFQHDGQKVISGSDRTLKMWNVRTGDFVKDLLTDLSGVWQVKFNERRCVAAVQRNNLTYIEVLDFGAFKDGIPEHRRGRRIVVNAEGQEVPDPHDTAIDLEVDD